MKSISRFLGFLFPDTQQQLEPDVSRRGSFLSSFFSGSVRASIPSVSNLPSISGPKRGVKRPHDETEDRQSPVRDNHLVTPEPKRRRIQTNTEQIVLDFDIIKSPIPSFTPKHTEGNTTSTATSPPDTPPPQIPQRDGASKAALGLWIGEYLCDKFSTSEFDFVEDRVIMKEMSWKLVDALEDLNPHNSITLTALIYLDRLLRGTEVCETFNDRDRASIMYRTYLLALHFAFIWLDDVPWSLKKIAECMELSLEDARLWERHGLVLLDYNLFIAEGIWPEYLDMLHRHATSTDSHDHIGAALQNIFVTAKDEYKASIQCVQAPSPAPSPPLPSPPQTPPAFAPVLEVPKITARRPQTPYPTRSSSPVDSDEDWDSVSEYSTASPERVSTPDQLPPLFNADSWGRCSTLPILQPKPVYSAYQFDSLLMAAA